MSNQRDIVKFIKSVSGQANLLTIPRIYITLTGGHKSALLLSQCVYWSDKSNDPDGWFYKTDDEWKEELGMTRGGLETATRDIGKWVSTCVKRVGPTPKTHYKVNLDLLVSSISELLESNKTDSLENSGTTNTEITTETTLESGFDKIKNEFNRDFRGELSGLQHKIDLAISTFSFEWVYRACEIAKSYNHPRWSYVNGILERWRIEGGPRDKKSNNSATKQFTLEELGITNR